MESINFTIFCCVCVLLYFIWYALKFINYVGLFIFDLIFGAYKMTKNMTPKEVYSRLFTCSNENPSGQNGKDISPKFVERRRKAEEISENAKIEKETGYPNDF